MYKQDLLFCYNQETHLNFKDEQHTAVKGWKNWFQVNGPKKQTSVAILISDKIDFNQN